MEIFHENYFATAIPTTSFRTLFSLPVYDGDCNGSALGARRRVNAVEHGRRCINYWSSHADRDKFSRRGLRS